MSLEVGHCKKNDGDAVYWGNVGWMEHFWLLKREWEGVRRRECAVRRSAFDGCIATSLLVVVLLTLFCLVAFLLFRWPTIDSSFADVPPDESDFRFVEVARMCGNDGHCRTVMDVIFRRNNSARRVIFFDGLSDTFESEVPLIRPQNATIDDSDTRLWHVDSSVLLNEYVAAMVVLPFIVASLSPSSADSHRLAQVMVIGLGGGSLDAFLHSKFPWLDITVYERDSVMVEMAKQWFDVVDDRTRRTVVGDGAVAISDHVRKGHQFDAIILDACDSSSPHISCPAAPFIAQEMLTKVKSALRPQGVFVLNSLPTSEQNEQKTLSLLQDSLLSVFPLCVRMTMGRQLNSIFACLPYAIGDNDRATTVHLWQHRKDEVAGQLQLRSLLRGARLIVAT